jgi:hypothetical protein
MEENIDNSHLIPYMSLDRIELSSNEGNYQHEQNSQRLYGPAKPPNPKTGLSHSIIE